MINQFRNSGIFLSASIYIAICLYLYAYITFTATTDILLWDEELVFSLSPYILPLFSLHKCIGKTCFCSFGKNNEGLEHLPFFYIAFRRCWGYLLYLWPLWLGLKDTENPKSWVLKEQEFNLLKEIPISLTTDKQGF